MNKTQIQETREYDKFSFQKGNREIKNKHVADLTVSVSKRNMLPNYPILVNEKFEIIDGQHRFMVSKNGGYPVYYTVIPDATLTETAMANVNMKTWQLGNYVEMFAAQGKSHYVWLLETMRDNALAATCVMLLARGNQRDASGAHIKSGNLKILAEEKENIANGIAILLALSERAKYARFRTQLYIEVCKLIKANKTRKLIEALKKTDAIFKGNWSQEDMQEYFINLVGEY